MANEVLRICAKYGRRFFSQDADRLERMGSPRISRFELDARGRIWFVDKWRGSRIFVHYDPQCRRGWSWKFSEGGTLLCLCQSLRNWIRDESAPVPLGYFGPWKEWVCGGDLWGYGEEMQLVRRDVAALFSPTEVSK